VFFLATAEYGAGVELAYMASALLFIFGIKRLAGVKTSRNGNRIAMAGMGLAVAATMYLLFGNVALWIILAGVLVGGGIGLVLAKRVPMTAMPELVAFFNGMGGAASMFVSLAEVARLSERRFSDTTSVHFGHRWIDLGGDAVVGAFGADFAIAVALSILIGGVTLSGSLVAYGKLAGKIRGMRFGPLGSKAVNALLGVIAVALIAYAGFFAVGPTAVLASHVALVVVALLLGVGLVVPIGGADMPVVISLLNSYSGLAASATGFVLKNNLLIVAGSLVGAAGLILTNIMCKAMNRSLLNVLAGGFGDDAGPGKDEGYTNVTSTSAEELAMILDAASSVIIVPGYGLAVAQAQHKTRELADLLAARDCEVSYAIHPVAGRMPGHMNVLLAEADVPYEQLKDLDQIQSEFKNADVAIVLGANDVANPAAVDDPSSPIAGMPVLHVWEAHTVVVVKRSLSPGYAGIKNPLFERDNCLMLFADAKKALEETVTELKEL
jgi:NAD(P) transhydrogenase subunit beta